MKTNWRLVVLTKRWNRNLKSYNPAQWETINRQTFEIKDKTPIGAKRAASKIIFNECDTPELYLKHPIWWGKWKIMEGEEPNAYRVSSINYKHHMRAELIRDDPY